MRFRLHYRGPLHSNTSIDRIQKIRRHFHLQLNTLWNSAPLKGRLEECLTHPGSREVWLRKVGAFTFLPLVNTQMFSIASLQITLLRPGELGSVVTRAGDIDNRLKTLFDALRVPDSSQLPKNDQPTEDEGIFFCLLDDDALVTEVDVITDRLLEPGVEESHVDMIIAVAIRSTLETVGAVQWTL